MHSVSVFGEHHTKRGKIVYREPRIRLMDMPVVNRLLLNEHNRQVRIGISELIKWRVSWMFIRKIASRNAVVGETINAKIHTDQGDIPQTAELGQFFKNWKEFNDSAIRLFSVIVPWAKKIPGFGWIVESAWRILRFADSPEASLSESLADYFFPD
jgi:hypothetical protein